MHGQDPNLFPVNSPGGYPGPGGMPPGMQKPVFPNDVSLVFSFLVSF